MSHVLRMTEEQFAARSADGNRPKQPAPLEHDEQAAFFTWWWQYADLHKLPRCLCFAIPNASALSDSGRVYKWREGLTKGVYDVFLSVRRGAYSGLYIEMKRMGGRVSPEQMSFGNAVLEQGYAAEVCFNAASAIDVADRYLKLRKP